MCAFMNLLLINEDEKEIRVLCCQKETVVIEVYVQCSFEKQREKKWLFSGWGQDGGDTGREGFIREMTFEVDFESWAEAGLGRSKEDKACCGPETLLRTVETLSRFSSPSVPWGRYPYPHLSDNGTDTQGFLGNLPEIISLFSEGAKLWT